MATVTLVEWERKVLPTQLSIGGMALLASVCLSCFALAQEKEGSPRERFIASGAQITEVTITGGLATLFGEKPITSTTITEVKFRLLPNPLEYIHELEIVIASGPPLRNRPREHLLPYRFGDEELILCGKQATIRELEIPMTFITDRGLKEFSAYEQLERLDLSHTKITDAGIAALAKATSLTELRIDMTEATDVSADVIAKIKTLAILDISGTKITEKIVPVLIDLPKLRKVIVHRDQFSASAMEQMKGKHKVVEID